jgi:glycosyltransferase involved in cell wall biosynthesis
MKRLHILAFEEAAGFGGAFVDLDHIVRHLLSHDCRVTIARSYDDDCWFAPEIAAAHLLPPHPNHLSVGWIDSWSRGSTSGRLLAAGIDLAGRQVPLAVKYAAYARQSKVDVIFTNNTPVLNAIGIGTGILARLPVISYVQGAQYDGRLLRALHPHVSHFFGVSNYISDGLMKLGIPARRISTLYPGVERRPATPERPADGRVVVGMVGMLTRWKGQLQFLDAFRRAAQVEPCLDAVLFGKPVPSDLAYADEVRRAVERGELRERVRLVEGISDPAQIYPLIDIGVHCSLAPEPFGRVVIEAMSFGRCVIAAPMGGPCEALEHGISGLLCDPNDTAALADMMVQLARSPARRRQLGDAAYAHVMQSFSYPHVLQPLTDVLTELVPGTQPL